MKTHTVIVSVEIEYTGKKLSRIQSWTLAEQIVTGNARHEIAKRWGDKAQIVDYWPIENTE